jgi:uncharacterized membrane protein YkvA (DUF1232 family)
VNVGDWLRGIILQVRLTWRLIRDPRVPLWTKAIPFLTLAYIFSPFDFLPDWFIGIGQLDDIALLVGSMRLMESLLPEYIIKEHRKYLERSDKPLWIVDAPKFQIKSGKKNGR